MNLSPTDPLAARLTVARRGGWRRPLHLVTDWPGYFPNGPAAVRLPIEAGADPSAPSDDGPSETPLHWAASSDDVEVAAALTDGGANLEASGGDASGRRSPSSAPISSETSSYMSSAATAMTASRITSACSPSNTFLTTSSIVILSAPATRRLLSSEPWKARRSSAPRRPEPRSVRRRPTPRYGT
jgi:Ankyrin repeat